jgi:uncharacterized protein (DUF1330 family)
MAKGYWIVRVDVKDEEPVKQYATGNHPIFEKFGGRYLVRAQKFAVPEGSSRSRQIVVEFPDYASALACYQSDEYQTNKKIRDGLFGCRLCHCRGLRWPAAIAALSGGDPGTRLGFDTRDLKEAKALLADLVV